MKSRQTEMVTLSDGKEIRRNKREVVESLIRANEVFEGIAQDMKERGSK